LANNFKFRIGFYSALLKTRALSTSSKRAGIPAQAVVATGFPELDGSWPPKFQALMKSELTHCAGFGWGRVNYLHSSYYAAMFWICVENSVDSTGLF